jgi:hypothetical protein
MVLLLLASAASAQTPVRTCESLASLSLPNAVIESATVEPAANARPAFCRVTAVVSHPPAADRVRIWIGLPTTGWNGRFQGVGGGGFSGGSANSVAGPDARASARRSATPPTTTASSPAPPPSTGRSCTWSSCGDTSS